MDGLKIDTQIDGTIVSVHSVDRVGTTSMIVKGIGRSFTVYLNREQRRQLAHALLKLDET